MARVELVMPKMGESILEATILDWVKKVGDDIDEDETILEIATDKVDSEIPSPVKGKIVEILFEKNAVVQVGVTLAILEAEGNYDIPIIEVQTEEAPISPDPKIAIDPAPKDISSPIVVAQNLIDQGISTTQIQPISSFGEKFYSPLVKSIAKAENISLSELNQISGTGGNGRVNKKDIQMYISKRKDQVSTTPKNQPNNLTSSNVGSKASSQSLITKSMHGEDELIEMGRMRKIIADHMVMSKKIAPHVTSFIEVDVTNIVNWRNKIKESYSEKYGEKITYTPIIIEAVAKALTDFPMVNISLEGEDTIRIKKDINIGMATALPNGNLIVPVIRNANHLSLNGLTKSVNSMAKNARENNLKPEDIQDGTFTVTNIGTFGNDMGTPIINQPQVAILAVGAIRKKPAVVETKYGDLIAVRQMMFCSLSYDHRVVDGFLGGSFLRKIGDNLEAFDINRVI